MPNRTSRASLASRPWLGASIVSPLAVVLIAAVVGLVLSSIGGCKRSADAGKKKPTVAYVTNGVAPFWVIGEAGARAAGKKFGVDVSTHEPHDLEDQKRIIEDLLTRQVDGIAISPIDPANQTGMLDQATERTKVVTQDSDAPASKRLCYVGMDNYATGRMCGKLVKEALPEGGKVMLFIGRVEQDNGRRRRQGLIDELAGRSDDPTRYDAPGNEPKTGKYPVLGTLTDNFDRAKGKQNAEDALSKYPDLDAMVGLFGYNPPLCLEAIKQAGKVGRVKMIAFDESDETLQAIQDGSCYGTIVQNPYRYGYESVRILAALTRGDNSALPPGGFLDIPARAIKKDNVDAFWADLKQKLAGGPPVPATSPPATAPTSGPATMP